MNKKNSTNCPKCQALLTDDTRIIDRIRINKKNVKKIYYKYYCRMCCPKREIKPNPLKKTCKVCKIEKKCSSMTIDKIYVSPINNTTKVYYKNLCKDCHNVKQNLKNKIKSELKKKNISIITNV